ELQANGGRMDLLPAGALQNVPPKAVDGLYGYADRIAKSNDQTSEWLYAKLAGNPQALGSMSDDQFFALRKELSEADFKHFSKERAKAQGKSDEAGASKAGDLNSSAIKTGLDQRMRVLGVDPTPKDGSNDAGRVGAIRQYVDQYFYAAQKDAGKKFSDAEVNAHLDAMFAKNQTIKGWFSDSSKPMLTMKAGDIPGVDRDNLRSAMESAGISDPTDAQMLGAYWNLQTLRDKAKQGQVQR
ncbi:MAG: lysin, partial [Ottowia sp.]